MMPPINPILLTDFYKVHHQNMYPVGTTMIYSNFTPRKSRVKGVDSVVFFGLQHFIKEYLVDRFKYGFFLLPWEWIEKEYKELTGLENVQHIKELHELGYLPIKIKALPEGTLVPIGCPTLTITNTHSNFAWLTNYLETLISTSLWQPITSATIAYQYKKIVDKYALETTGSTEGTQWQCHDFSMRGMSSVESSILSGMGHLTSFTGTDTIPAIQQLKNSYGATGLIGASVPATEHSVMCMGTKNDEIGTFERLLDLYPNGILSVVSDTWNLWTVLTDYLPKLRDKVLSRDGKLVIRPDSGDPVKIICGYNVEEVESKDNFYISQFDNIDAIKVGGKYYALEDDYEYGDHIWVVGKELTEAEVKGVVELLWETFSGVVNEKGYKVLDSHIGAIYGDSITIDRARQISERLKNKGFASTNIVFGVGSYTYQYNTRDTFGFAMKATYGEVTHHYPANLHNSYVEAREIFKDPITDDGTKKSKKGLLRVEKYNGVLQCKDQCTKFEENTGLLEVVFEDGKLVKEQTLNQIRELIKNQ